MCTFSHMLLDFSYTDLRVQFSSLVVNSGCTEGDVRLAGGETAMEGRVEVCHNQTWWAVSGWYWDFNDATVVCRHLHYPANCKRVINAKSFIWLKTFFNQYLLNLSNTNDFYPYIQGQFPCPLHILEEEMPQYWFEISDVLVESSHSGSVDLVTTPSLLITLMAIMYLTGMFTAKQSSPYFCSFTYMI